MKVVRGIYDTLASKVSAQPQEVTDAFRALQRGFAQQLETKILEQRREALGDVLQKAEDGKGFSPY